MQCSPPVHLSPRELQLVRSRAKGLAYKQIAAELKISINTVKTHLRRIFLKLDIQCSLELLQRMQASDCLDCPYQSGSPAANTADTRRRRLLKIPRLVING